MSGIRELDKLLANIEPTLDETRYVFVTRDLPLAAAEVASAFAVVREDEATTLIIDAAVASTPLPDECFARVTLSVHSALAAVGLTAAVADVLAARAIPANVVAGYYHDHIFVPYKQRFDALDALQSLAVTKM